MRILLALFLSLLPAAALADQELNIFERDRIISIWPVPGPRLPREPDEVSRKTRSYTLSELEADRAKGRFRLGSIVMDASNLPGMSKLQAICVITPAHISAHDAEYQALTQRSLDSIQVIDAYSPTKSQNFKLTLSAGKDAGILSKLFPALNLEGELEVEFVSKNARDRYFLYEDDRDFLRSKIAEGPVCAKGKRAQFAHRPQYNVDNYTYGVFEPRVKMSAGFWGFSTAIEKGKSLYGAILYRPMGMD